MKVHASLNEPTPLYCPPGIGKEKLFMKNKMFGEHFTTLGQKGQIVLNLLSQDI